MTNKEKILNVLQDKRWHCAICDLGGISSQHAAIIRELIKKDGCEFETDPGNPRRSCMTKFCSKCNKSTIHRKLK